MLKRILSVLIMLIVLANCVYAQKVGDIYHDKNHKDNKGVAFAGGAIVERYLHLGASDYFIGVEIWKNGKNILPKFYPWKRQYSDSYEEVGHGLYGGCEIISDTKILIFNGYPPLKRPFDGYIFELKPGQTHFTLCGKNLTDTIITRDNYNYSRNKIITELKGETNLTRAFKTARSYWEAIKNKEFVRASQYCAPNSNSMGTNGNALYIVNNFHSFKGDLSWYNSFTVYSYYGGSNFGQKGYVFKMCGLNGNEIKIHVNENLQVVNCNPLGMWPWED